MKRRRFLSLLGAATAAPLMPVPALARAAPAYPAGAVGAATVFAKRSAVFSVFGLSKNVGISVEQAEALMADLAKRGVVSPLRGSTKAGRWVSSKVFTSDTIALARLKREHRASTRQLENRDGTDGPAQTDGPTEPWADLRPFLTHLHRTCRQTGFRLTPRALSLTPVSGA